MALSNKEFLTTIENQIQAKHVLTHPFYQAWTKGELTMEALRDYAAQYYHHVAAFPGYLSAVHADCEDLNVRKRLLQNLIDEEAGSPNHPDLWLQFAESLGLDANSVKQGEVAPETQELIEAFRSICKSGDTAAGVAALYSYESQIPDVSIEKIEGLKKHYGASDPQGYHYFTVHIEADKEHAREEREMLGQLLNSENSENAAVASEKVLGALWNLLSGVCHRHNISCH